MVAIVLAGVIGSQFWNSPFLWRAASIAGLATSAVRPVDASACEPSDGGRIVVAAVLRNEGQGWFAISDDGHRPMNVRSVETTATGIVIGFSFVADKVLTFIVTPDETLAERGYFAGASVGLESATIRLSSASVLGSAERSPLGVSGSSSNLWVYGLFDGQCVV